MDRKLLGEIQSLGNGRYGLLAYPSNTGQWVGGFRPYDVGKRVYLIDGIHYMENDAQRVKRQDKPQ